MKEDSQNSFPDTKLDFTESLKEGFNSIYRKLAGPVGNFASMALPAVGAVISVKERLRNFKHQARATLLEDDPYFIHAYGKCKEIHAPIKKILLAEFENLNRKGAIISPELIEEFKTRFRPVETTILGKGEGSISDILHKTNEQIKAASGTLLFPSRNEAYNSYMQQVGKIFEGLKDNINDLGKTIKDIETTIRAGHKKANTLRNFDHGLAHLVKAIDENLKFFERYKTGKEASGLSQIALG